MCGLHKQHAVGSVLILLIYYKCMDSVNDPLPQTTTTTITIITITIIRIMVLG